VNAPNSLSPGLHKTWRFINSCALDFLFADKPAETCLAERHFYRQSVLDKRAGRLISRISAYGLAIFSISAEGTWWPRIWRKASSSTSSLPARIPAIVGRTSTLGTMPTPWVGLLSG
jgi:hypothetical protein